MMLLNVIGFAAALALVAGGIGWLARPAKRLRDPYEFDEYNPEGESDA